MPPLLEPVGEYDGGGLAIGDGAKDEIGGVLFRLRGEGTCLE